ncbi:hypothetical protein EJB05_37136, partial [Eragrostis curvula]
LCLLRAFLYVMDMIGEKEHASKVWPYCGLTLDCLYRMDAILLPKGMSGKVLFAALEDIDGYGY